MIKAIDRLSAQYLAIKYGVLVPPNYIRFVATLIESATYTRGSFLSLLAVTRRFARS